MCSAVVPEPFVIDSFTSSPKTAPSASSVATFAARPRRAASISGVSPASICAREKMAV